MTKLTLPRRDFLAMAGATLTASAFPLVEAFGAEALNFGFQETSWGTVGMICEAQGLFKKEKAPVHALHFSSGKDTRDAMISGRIDMGIIGATPFIVGAAKGQMEAIGLALYGSKTLAVVAGLDKGINAVKDLKGHRVGSQLGSATDYVFQNKILPKAGLSKSDVQIVNVRFQNHVSALAAGSIDAFAGVEPFPSLAEVNKLGKVLTDYSPYDLQPVILACSTETVKKRRNDVVEFLRAWLDGVKLFKDDRDKATQIVLTYFEKKGFKVSDKVIKLMLSKIDVNPDFKPELKEYLTRQSNVLMKGNKIAAVPDWDKLLNHKLLAEAQKS
ncbi:MAG TPA: ABC transporter substrate-binding protein [Pseudolabrys sp.]|nr:ABC transporter substrate-binding protein [Pseudolabrys sp.]